jgi:hypothetical protein
MSLKNFLCWKAPSEAFSDRIDFYLILRQCLPFGLLAASKGVIARLQACKVTIRINIQNKCLVFISIRLFNNDTRFARITKG